MYSFLIPSTTAESHPPFCFFFSPLFKVIHSSLSIFLSFSWSQRPPTHFSFCCKYRGLNGMVLYLAGRCAITQDYLDHNRTLGLRLEACHVLSLPRSVCLFLAQIFCLCPLSHFYLPVLLKKGWRLDSNCHPHLEVVPNVWECLTPTRPACSDITCCTCKTMWMDNYSPQVEKQSGFSLCIFSRHVKPSVCLWCERSVHMPLDCPVWSKTFLQGHGWNICSCF